MSHKKNKMPLIDAQEWAVFCIGIKKLCKNIVPKSAPISKLLPLQTEFPKAPLKLLKPRNISIGNSSNIDKNLAKKMDQGEISVDAKLDLHGKTLAEAHKIAISFILNSYSLQYRLLLIVTGKGKQSPNNHAVLRDELPKWLNDEKISGMILRCNYAHQKHGGEGAFYILLRRHR